MPRCPRAYLNCLNIPPALPKQNERTGIQRLGTNVTTEEKTADIREAIKVILRRTRFNRPKNRQQKNPSSARGVKAPSSALVTFIVLQSVTNHEVRNVSRRVENSLASLFRASKRGVRISHYWCAASWAVLLHDEWHQIS